MLLLLAFKRHSQNLSSHKAAIRFPLRPRRRPCWTQERQLASWQRNVLCQLTNATSIYECCNNFGPACHTLLGSWPDKFIPIWRILRRNSCLLTSSRVFLELCPDFFQIFLVLRAKMSIGKEPNFRQLLLCTLDSSANYLCIFLSSCPRYELLHLSPKRMDLVSVRRWDPELPYEC